MIKRKFILFAVCLLLFLISCSSDVEEKESNSPTASTEAEGAIVVSRPFQTAPPSYVIPAETFYTQEDDAIYFYYRVLTEEHNEVYLQSVSSAADEVTLYHQVGDFPRTERVALRAVQLPNIKVLNIDEGIREVIFYEANDDLANLEVFCISSTCTLIKGNIYRFPNGGIPVEMEYLKEIRVAEGNECYWDVDGALFSNGGLPSSAENQQQLVCIPQSFETLYGMLAIPENTTSLGPFAIYRCQNVDTLAIPDSVTHIAENAIIATAEHPMRIICSPGSAAEKYVLQYGKEHHLFLAEN